MVGPFALDGYDVLAPLDAVGRRWRAVCLADGRRVVLRRWTGAGARLTEVRRLAALWSSAAGDAVVPVRDVVRHGGDLVVVTEAGGDVLDTWLANHRTLRPGQVVTLVVPVATALAAAHEHGLAHGRLDSASLVLDDAGRPRLTDYVFGAGAEPAADVAALVELAVSCVDATVPVALLAALDPSIDARGLADQVLASVPAEPLNDFALAAAPVAARTSSGSRVRAAVALVVGVVVIAAVAGAWWGRHDPAAGAALPPRIVPIKATAIPSPTPSTGTNAASLPAVVRDLEQQRAQALARADADGLAAVEVRGSTLWRRDARVVSGLAAAHAHLRGLRVRLVAVHVDTVTAQQATVQVVDALSSYDVVDANGVVLAHHAARQRRATNLVLIRENGNWLLQKACSGACHHRR